MNVTLATKLRLFGQTVQFGADWDFSADDNPRKMLAGILHSLFWGSTPSCPATPGEQSPPANSQVVSTTLTPTVMEEDNAETTLRVTFKHADLEGYPGLKVDWADGTSSTIPAGQARTVSATHRYKNHGKYPVKVVVADSGAFSAQATATVTNIAPSIGFLQAEPMPATEGGVVTLRGRVNDRGAADTPHREGGLGRRQPGRDARRRRRVPDVRPPPPLPRRPDAQRERGRHRRRRRDRHRRPGRSWSSTRVPPTSRSSRCGS